MFNNSNTKVQTFVSDDLVIDLKPDQKPKPGKMMELAKDQSAIIIDDFNFDGTEDIALRNGNMGNYHSASYDVYVFNSTRMSFVKVKNLRNLHQTDLIFWC
ncbi:hypothetical protein EJ377_15420 [Chryseobacterium arthrosphaerae]|uniref:VCBS repeat-containing protein n=1 Tax=Chryseobacterium arthrosphaerae TaxID=651561 RepID=A0A3S0QSQ6_9FLAO|nr:hypothetical protein EJ377_15420 [Chryseobacterium arthrosphaerae]